MKKILYIIILSIFLTSCWTNIPAIKEIKDSSVDTTKSISNNKVILNDNKNKSDNKSDNNIILDGNENKKMKDLLIKWWVKKIPKLCWWLNDKDRTICFDKYYSENAVLNKNSFLCYKVSTLKWKQSCKDDVILTNVTADSKLSYCDKIKDKKKKQLCISSLTTKESIKKDDVWLCSTLNGESKTKCETEAFINFAIKDMDKSKCNKIPKKEDRDVCIWIINSVLWK